MAPLWLEGGAAGSSSNLCPRRPSEATGAPAVSDRLARTPLPWTRGHRPARQRCRCRRGGCHLGSPSHTPGGHLPAMHGVCLRRRGEARVGREPFCTASDTEAQCARPRAHRGLRRRGQRECREHIGILTLPRTASMPRQDMAAGPTRGGTFGVQLPPQTRVSHGVRCTTMCRA